MEVLEASGGRDHRSVRTRVASPDLIGRKAERGALVEALDRATRGQAGIVLLGGDAGMGKTRLVQDVMTDAERRGCLVLIGGCVDLAEGAMPLAPLVGALRDLPRAVAPERLDDVIGAAAPALAWLVPGLVEGDEGAPLASPARLFELLLGLVRRLGGEAPTLVVFEDLHWADQSTRDLLMFLARNLTDERVLVVATFRTDELHRRHPLRPLAAELERSATVERLDLRPLTREETAAQLAAIGGRAPRTDLVDEIHSRAEGNPFYAEELFAVAASGDGGLPSTVRDALLERLTALGEQHQQIARVAAAVGRSVDDDLLAELVELDPNELEEVLRDLVAANLLGPSGDGYAFRHALLQEAAYGELLPGERARLHARIAQALQPRPGTPPAVLAHHWYEARRLPEAFSAAIEAGLAAERASALAEAVVHLGMALDLWDAVPDADARTPLPRADLLMRTANAALLAGDFDRGLALVRQAIATVDCEKEPVRAGLLYERLGRYLWVADRAGDVDAHQEAVRLVPADPPSKERATVLAGLGQALMLSGRLAEAVEVCREAVAVAIAAGSRQAEGHARNSMGVAQIGLTQGAEGLANLEAALAIADEIGNAEDIGRGYVNLTHGLGELGRDEEVVARAERGLAICRRLGIDRTHGVYLDANAAEAQWRLGQWDEALARMLAASRRLPTGYWVYFNAAPLQVERGELDVAAATFGDGRLPEGTATLQNLLEFRTGQASLAIWQGHPELVRPIVRETLERLPPRTFAASLGPLLWRAAWAEADLAEAARARRDEAAVAEAAVAGRHVLDVLHELVDGYEYVALPRYRVLLEAELARLEAVPTVDAWRRAASPESGPSAVYERAYAGFRLAEAMAAGGDRAGAASTLASAKAVAERLGAVPLLGLIDDLGRRAGLDPAGADGDGAGGSAMGLTDRERQVLTLVAEGRSNREIADELFISPKTASVHVSNILAKVGAKSRGEAAAIARRAGLIETG